MCTLTVNILYIKKKKLFSNYRVFILCGTYIISRGLNEHMTHIIILYTVKVGEFARRRSKIRGTFEPAVAH